MHVLRKGSHGESVTELQDRLNQLGFDLESDGVFGEATHNAIITLQTIFGYDVDGAAGPATLKLIDTQSGYGWSLLAARNAYAPSGDSSEHLASNDTPRNSEDEDGPRGLSSDDR